MPAMTVRQAGLTEPDLWVSGLTNSCADSASATWEYSSFRRPVGRPRVGVRGAKSIAEAAHGGPALVGRRIAAVRDAAQVVRAPCAGIGGDARQRRGEQRQQDNGD